MRRCRVGEIIAAGVSMPRLSPCSSCQAHVFVDEPVCPHCGASLRTVSARIPAVLVGLALTGCPQVEPVYGVPDTGPSEGSDTNVETGTENNETETGSDTETTTVGEPEYGVPDSG